MTSQPAIIGFATQGAGSGDDRRLRQLLADVDAEVLDLERQGRFRTAAALARRLIRSRGVVVVMEGTGTPGGLVLLALRARGLRFVVSSGDAVGPFIAAAAPGLGWLGAAYERALCRCCAGYVGWTPYLTGRAITFGAPRAVTIPGWGLPRAPAARRDTVRASWGVSPDEIVFGILGSLTWNPRYRYCYGLELVKAAAAVQRRDIVVVIVGDGDGKRFLEQALTRSGARVIMPGIVPHHEVPAVLSAIDVASLPQSIDRVGMFRYSTKLPEYLAAGLPIVTGQLPMAYDLDGGWLRRLPGSAPWDQRYISAMSEMMDAITWEEIAQLKSQVPRQHALFDRTAQQQRMREFLQDLIATTL